MFLWKPNYLFAPNDATGAPAGGGMSGGSPSVFGTREGTVDKDDTIKFLAEDDKPEDGPIDLTPKPKKDKSKEEDDDEDKDEKTPRQTLDEDDEDKDDKDDEDDEDDDLEALLEETQEPTEEQLELTTPVRRKEILKKYPNLFKEFPYLEKAYYREQQFTEVFPTIDDARNAAESVETLQRFEKDLMGGNLETILKAVKEENSSSFSVIVDELLPTLAKVDEGAYHHLLGNTIKHTIISMLQEGQRNPEAKDVLTSAAQILNQFVFGSSQFQQPTKFSKTEKPEEKGKDEEITKREQDFTRRQFETARGELNTRVNNSLKATIEGNIDPKNSMTDYVKRQAVRDATEMLTKLFSQDKRFGEITDRLWKAAFDSNFSKDSVDRIRSAYLSKARTLLPSVIKKARNEALRGMGKRVRDTEEETPRSGDKTERPRSKNSGNKTTKPGEVPAGMKTLDFLMQD